MGIKNISGANEFLFSNRFLKYDRRFEVREFPLFGKNTKKNSRVALFYRKLFFLPLLKLQRNGKMEA